MSTLENIVCPTDPSTQLQLQKEMAFSYRQVIGELLFAAIIFRPDIFQSIVKLSQHNTKSAIIDYMAIKHVFHNRRDTVDDELHFWRTDPYPILLSAHQSHIFTDNHAVKNSSI